MAICNRRRTGDVIRKEEYIVYGSDNCGYCTRAKEILEQYGRNYRYIDVMIDEVPTEFYHRTNNAKTLPQVFMHDPVRSYGDNTLEVHIGGYTELEKWLEDRHS